MSRAAGIAGGLTAGSMLAVWQNATETEVYALSLLLACLMLVVGERAGRLDSRRHRILLVYLMALAVPLQISALVAAPAAVWLAAQVPARPQAVRGILVTTGSACLLVTGAGLVSVPIAVAGAAGLAWSTARARSGGDAREALTMIAVAALGVTATLFMLARATHDPLVNQGNPASVPALLDVIGRRQYDVPGPWPRRAPVWVQLLNLVQYADWQVASGLDNGVAASWLRTPWSVLFAGLAVVGARWHWRRDVPSARVVLGLLAVSTLGVVAVLNLRAGPSILDAVLPPGSTHEPRERDYFFALAFAVTGLWAGAGAWAVASRLAGRAPRGGIGRARAYAVMTLAVAPVALNWRVANRRRSPEAGMAASFGEAVLRSSPPRALLLLAGDNDSYPVWYRQAVLRERTDVVPVTLPLLGARWYREELRRRYDLLGEADAGQWHGGLQTVRSLVAEARRQRRPVAVGLSVPRDVRVTLAPSWVMRGLVFTLVPDDPTQARVESDSGMRGLDAVDDHATRDAADFVARRFVVAPHLASDASAAYVGRLLECPDMVLALRSGDPRADAALLASRCNFK